MPGILLLLALLIGSLAPNHSSAAEIAPLPDADRDGRELAMKLRDAFPDTASSFTGLLQTVTKDDRVRRVPLRSEIVVTPTNWIARYESVATNGIPGERLVITHTVGKSNRYERWINGTNAPVGALETLFAGSDFSVIDLGLEFLHWPKQRRLGHEMRHSRSCHILESTNPSPSATGYARVKSWVDIENGGIVRAEAYDRASGEIKFFKVDGVGKKDGRWQVESVEIRSKRTGQETKLIFDAKSE